MARTAPVFRTLPVKAATAERIVAAATSLFALKGYDGTSTKEICDAAGVNIAAIHYHFESKEELLRTILVQFGSASLDSVRRILTTPATFEEFKTRISIFLEEVLESYLRNPELWSIIQSEAVIMHPRTEDLFRSFFAKRCEALVTFFIQAKKKRIISRTIDPEIAARNLFGLVCHQARMDSAFKELFKISLKTGSYRKRWIEQTLESVCFGVRGESVR